MNKADWIILDVPCSSTGTIRRNPDIKFRFSEEFLKKDIMTQQEIIEKSLKYLKPNGKIVYITCSLLAEENEDQISKCIKQFGLEVVDGEFLKITTKKNEMDSMFAVVLQRKKS